jgi:Glycosyltransferase WbsX
MLNVMTDNPSVGSLPIAKIIAFYLPQYHPIPENDAWWGKGFTEWTNVAKARPLFRGHYQPHLPADLGFYDLRLPEAREAQAALARQHGIYGFCYYHYWFSGRRLLERPYDEVLASGKPDFPFCLCWANENWTRRWDGAEEQILMAQTYSVEDDINHIRWLFKAFEDPRYIRVEGKPLFLVYRPGDLPAPAQTADTWRREARKAGIGEIFLCAVVTFFKGSPTGSSQIGFDATLEFQPTFSFHRGFFERVWKRLQRGISNNVILDYCELMRQSLDRPQGPCRRFLTVVPCWDNTPRRKVDALILGGACPEKYAEWLEIAIDRSTPLATGEKLVFVNAWNEWGEGNHLEPCQRWGRAYLEATRAVVERRDAQLALSDATQTQ